jgi:hypothetical protein
MMTEIEDLALENAKEVVEHQRVVELPKLKGLSS